MAIAFVLPFNACHKVWRYNLRLFLLSFFLAAFALSHSFHHLAEFFHEEFLADVILLPLSVSFLLAFGLYYVRSGE